MNHRYLKHLSVVGAWIGRIKDSRHNLGFMLVDHIIRLNARLTACRPNRWSGL
jgi:peptidyl-tRNA hydrolase